MSPGEKMRFPVAKVGPLVCIQSFVRQPAIGNRCEGANWIRLCLSSSLFLQQFPTNLILLAWMVGEIKRKWPYRCCFFFLSNNSRICSQTHLVFLFNFHQHFMHFVRLRLVQPPSITVIVTGWKKSCFIYRSGNIFI